MGTPPIPPPRPAPAPARWHRAGDPWPLYATLEPATAWAEWQAASGGIDPADERRRLWTLDVRDLAVVDLRDAATRSTLDVNLDELTDGWAAPQRLAARLRATGAEGVIAPSAARPGHWSLVVFPTGFGRITVRGGRTLRPRPPSSVNRRRRLPGRGSPPPPGAGGH